MPDQDSQNPKDKIYYLAKCFGDGIDFFLDSISSLETGIVNIFCHGDEKTNNKSDDSANNLEKNPKHKISNIEKTIFGFLAIMTRDYKSSEELEADSISKWKASNLSQSQTQYSDNEIQIAQNKTCENALNLLRKISDDDETQREINLITLLHEHRLKLIREILNNKVKSEGQKLQEIKDILENKVDFQQHMNLASNIYYLTEANFQPDASEPSRQSSNNESTSSNSDANPPTHRGIYPQYTIPTPEDLDRSQSFSDQKTKEELLFRLNDFKYSCLGVLDSGFHDSNQIEALKGLLEEHSAQTRREDFVKKHADLKSAIGDKIETGVARLELGLKNKMKKSTEKDVENILKQHSNLSGAIEKDKANSILVSKAEYITESMLKLDFDEIKESLSNFSYAVKQMMYFYTFQQISYARGKELAEAMSENDDMKSPLPSPQNSIWCAPSNLGLEVNTPPHYDNFIDTLDTVKKAREEESTYDEILDEIEFQEIAQPFKEPPIPAPRRLLQNKNGEGLQR
jgi:hypothetical protein